MPRTSSSIPESQTRPLPQEGTTLASMQTPPLITGRGDGGVGQVYQKAESDGLKSKSGDAKDHGSQRNDTKNDRTENVCIIDVRNGEDKESVSSEKVCRICQLSSDQLPVNAENVNLVLLGCACKGELGISHHHCAVVWFQQKGNRTCEICGKPAKNIEGIEDTGFRAYGADISIIASAELTMNSSLYERDHRRTRSLCNFLLAALVLAFLLPWAIHPSKLL